MLISKLLKGRETILDSIFALLKCSCKTPSHFTLMLKLVTGFYMIACIITCSWPHRQLLQGSVQKHTIEQKVDS